MQHTYTEQSGKAATFESLGALMLKAVQRSRVCHVPVLIEARPEGVSMSELVCIAPPAPMGAGGHLQAGYNYPG